MKPLAFLAFAGLALAQDAQPPLPEIHGKVIEFGTHYGIAGAQVELLVEGRKQPVSSTVTDSQGAYDIHPGAIGHYTIRVQMEGYKPLLGGEVPGGLSLTAALLSRAPATSEVRVVITNGNPKEEANFTFVRPGELRGRVIDEETGVPLAKVAVKWATPNAGGGVAYLGGPSVLTDDDGQFVFPTVLPANYAIEIHAVEQIIAKFSEQDASKVDEGLETTFWPGGREFNANATFTVGSGQSLNAGTIKARKASYYRLRVNVTPGCPSGQNMNLQLIPVPASAERLNGSVPCGSDFLITNVPPGSYSLQIVSGPAATRAMATTPVEIRDRNVTVAAALERGIDIDGRIVTVDGVDPPPMAQITVLVQQPGMANAVQTPDAQGQFRWSRLPRGRTVVSVLRAPAGFYLREIRYSGQTQPDDAFVVDPAASSQTLELVLDNKPSAITGVVEDNDNPVNQPYVVAVKWPASLDMAPKHRISGSADGKFRIAGLPPGEYRVLAVSDANKDKLSEPGVLERLLPYAEKVTLDRGAAQDVHLKLVDPNR